MGGNQVEGAVGGRVAANHITALLQSYAAIAQAKRLSSEERPHKSCRKVGDSQWSGNVPTKQVIIFESSPPAAERGYNFSLFPLSNDRKVFFLPVQLFWEFLFPPLSRTLKQVPSSELSTALEAFYALSSVMSESLIYTQQPLIMFLCSFFLCFPAGFICYSDSLFSPVSHKDVVPPPPQQCSFV
ncbi:hypothetical protein J6590_016307 [Homalodisca vitripennis]|nr:hypothetical protein J6590_016307 [Homalodisca vitripennis]